MESILKGLKGLKEGSERASKSGDSKFLKIGDGEAVTIRFMQELDESGKNFDEARGVAVGIFEHVNPEDFRQSFICTKEEEGRCAGCERVVLDRKWRARGRLLVNVLVRGSNGEPPKVKVLTTSLGTRGLTPTLVEFAEEYGTLCDREYRYKRSGEGLDTTYTILPREPVAMKKEEAALPVVPLEEVFRNLSYAEQVDLLGSTGDAKEDW